MLAECLRRRGALADALEVIGTPPDSGDGAALARLLLGRIELERDHARQAERLLLESLEIDADQIAPRRQLLDLYVLEERRAAVDRMLTTLEPLTALTYDEMALWSIGRRLDDSAPDAVLKLEAILQADPEDINARVALANRLRSLGKLAAAEHALAPMPYEDPRAAVARAAIEFDRGRLDAAEQALRHAARDDPEAMRLHGRLGLSRRHAVEASAGFERALKVHPDDVEALVGLSQAQRMAHAADAALETTARLSKIESLLALVSVGRTPSRRDDPATLVEIARRMDDLGRPRIARGWYRMALKQAASSAEIQHALFRLDRLIPPQAP